MNSQNSQYDVVVIGGGFYGCMLALFFGKSYKRVLLLEKEKTLLTGASYHNQARIHNGYHYPRNFLTALRSHRNYSKFIDDFHDAVEDSQTMIYAIARFTSKVTSSQFFKLCKQINAPLKPTPKKLQELFDKRMIEETFLVDEKVFNAAKVREILMKKLENSKIIYSLGVTVTKVVAKDDLLEIMFTNGTTILAKRVINCTYSQINTILANSDLPLLPLKHEYAEMPLVEMPGELKKIGITIMDGPFFSLMPFPDKKLHSFHHVRYTPHHTWINEGIKNDLFKNTKSKFLYMKKDALRYIPSLQDLKHRESLYQVKTVLLQNEMNDGRPILFRKDYGLKNFDVIMGGKIDNIYDVCSELEKETALNSIVYGL